MKGEDPLSTVSNTIFFLVLLLTGSILLLLVYRLRQKALQVIFAFAITTTMFTILTIYLDAAAIAFGLRTSDELILMASLFGSLLSVALVALGRWRSLAAATILILGSFTGALLSCLIPPSSIIAIALTASIFDIYSVFRGPLSKILPKPSKDGVSGELPRELRWVVVPFRGLSIGLGDIIFYSMIASLAFSHPYLSITRWLAVSISLTLGNYLTLRLLRRRPVLPALPIPATLALATYIIAVNFGI